MPELQTLNLHEKDPGGGFMVRRSLPSALRQSVGPFVFFDHVGPITAQPGDDHAVRPHPHIGLATVTCLVEGATMHRDSTGAVHLDLNVGPASGVSLTIPDAAEERALYGVDRDVELDGALLPARAMVVLERGSEPVPTAPRGGRIALIGGTPLGQHFIVRNFVSSRRERIVQAQDDWEAQRFERVPGETEFIPLPPRRP